MTALALNKAYSADMTKRRLFAEAFAKTKDAFVTETVSFSNRAIPSGKTEPKPDLHLLKTSDPSDSAQNHGYFSLSMTFVTDELSASAAFESLAELAAQMFLLGIKTTVIARLPRPSVIPENMDYRQVGLAGDPLSVIPDCSLIVCGTYSMLRAIKTFFDIPLVYFACEDDYLYPEIDIKEKLLMASAFNCADLTICFNSRIHKKLSQEYGLNIVTMPLGIDGKLFDTQKHNPSFFREGEKKGLKDLNADGTLVDSDDNFWHMQRNSFYRKNGVFGKERFDFSYHFMMRESNESLVTENVEEAEEPGVVLGETAAGDDNGDTTEDFTGVSGKKLLFVLERESPLSSVEIINKVAEMLGGTDVRVVAAVKGEVSSLSERVLVMPVTSPEALAALYARAHIYVSVDKGANFAVYALMAMAGGVPVVSSDHCGIVDFARHGDNAMLGPIADAKSAVDLIKRVLGDENLVSRLQKGGLITAETYEWERLRDAYLRLFVTLADTCRKEEAGEGPEQGEPVLRNRKDSLSASIAAAKQETGFETEETPDGKYKIKLLSPETHLRLNLDALEWNREEASLAAARLGQRNFYALAVPVARKVVGGIRNVSWEVIAANEEAKERYGGKLTKLYLGSYASSELFPKQTHPAVLALAKGDYLRAVSAFESSGDASKHNAVMLRWVIVALMGLGRFEDALETALRGCGSYMFNPDFYLLAYHCAREVGRPLPADEMRRELGIMGPGTKFPEWFADPLYLLEADNLIGV